MKIALVHEMLVKMGGAERVLDVLQQIFPQAPIYTLLYDEKKCGETFAKEKVRTSYLQKWMRMKVPRQLLVSKMPAAIEDFDFSGYDLVISSSSAFAHGIVTPVETKHICYCHAPMRYGWDYTHQYIREKSEGSFSGIKKLFLQQLISRLRIWDYAAASRPHLLLANSKTTQERIQKFWRRESEVLFPPVETARFEQGESHEGYFLIVSALARFKSIDIAIEAFNQLPQHRLVIIGDGADRARLENIAGENIEFLGRKSDQDIVQFLKNCRALIFPGEEDFGIVPVEAMASGKPVIAYKKGGVTETVLEGKTGLFFSEPTAQSLFKTLAEFFVLEAKRTFSAKSCVMQAEKFSRVSFEKGLEKNIQTLFGEK